MKKYGTIHPKKTLLLRMETGTAEAGGVKYELTINMGNNTPIVSSSKTGKYFTLSWQDIINLAIDAGINK